MWRAKYLPQRTLGWEPPAGLPREGGTDEASPSKARIRRCARGGGGVAASFARATGRARATDRESRGAGKVPGIR
jgi:hypothetical protein